MTFANMKLQVAAYVNRDAASLVEGSADYLKNAINRARRWAEKRHNFELARTSAQVPSVNYSTGGSLANAVLQSDGATPVSVKVIERAFLADTNGRTFPIDLLSRSDHMRRVSQRFDRMVTTSWYDWPDASPRYKFALMQQGATIYVTPADVDALGGETFTVYLDIVKWFADYSADGDTDFFLTECEDLVLYRSILELNQFLKEDKRVKISGELMTDAWDSALQWDKSIVQGAVDVSLD